MHTSASSGSLSSRRREPRLTYLLRPTDAAVHICGVNALALSPDGRHLFSGGRDGSVRRWQAGDDAAAASAGGSHGCFEGHTDWVTALAWVGPSLLCSASCDATLRLWHADDASPPGDPPAAAAATLRAHRDYVTSLAAAGSPGGPVTHFASGGLGGQLLLWDANEARTVASSAGGADPAPVPAGGAKASIYALAAAGPSALLAGGAERVLRLWDARAPGACAAKLRGHADTVRALLVDGDGRRAVSAGADRGLRLWDLRSQRCVAALPPAHTDSVWALAGDASLSAVWSGGRDGAVWHAALAEAWGAADATAAAAASRATLLAAPRGGEPVTALALDGAGGAGSGVWVATQAAALQRWSRDPGPPPPGPPPVSASGPAFRGVRPPALAASARHAAPLATLRGAPGLRRAEVLPDRRRLLTQDSAGEMAIWDMQAAAPSKKVPPPAPKPGLRGTPSAQPLTPAQAFDAARAELGRQRCAVPSWFTADTRTGSLAIHLDCPGAFAAEAYAADDLGVAGAADDAKLNLGAEALRCVLGPFARRRHRLLTANAAPEDEEEEPLQPPVASCFTFPLKPPPTLVFDAPDGTRQRWDAYNVKGSDAEAAALPTWAVDLVLYNRMPPGCAEAPKMAFHLLPAQDSGLAPLATAKLNAPRILRVSKIAQYVASKLDLAADMDEGDGDVTTALELSCAGQVLAAEMTLASVQQFVWRKPGEELLIHYAPKRNDAGRRLL